MPLLVGLLVIASLLSPIAPHSPVIELPISQAQAETEIAPLNMKAQGLVVVEKGSEQPVVSYRKDQDWSIASLTKVMTALVYLEQNPDLNKVIAMTKEDMVGGAALKVPVGTKMTAETFLHASLMGSANNATVSIARAGTDMSLDEFIEKMNQKARELGLEKTRFVEPTGLSPDNKSTPQEYAKIMSLALDHPIISSIMQKTQYQLRTLNAGSFPIGNTNKLLRQGNPNFEVVGGKTGFTYGSDYNFATKVKKGEKEVVVVVFGDETMNAAIEHSKELAEDALEETD